MGQTPTNPKRSLLRRIFSEPMSDSTKKDWPELEKSWAGRQIESPNTEGSVTSIKPFGLFDYWKNPDAYASTGPLGGIRLNRERIETEKQDINDVLMHEMTHANQGAGGFLRKFYNPSAVEDPAVNAEALRKVRKTDIHLR